MDYFLIDQMPYILLSENPNIPISFATFIDNMCSTEISHTKCYNPATPRQWSVQRLLGNPQGKHTWTSVIHSATRVIFFFVITNQSHYTSHRQAAQ